MQSANLIARLISAACRHQLAYLSSELVPYRLGGGSYTYLLMIVEHPGITQSELVEKVMIDRATVSKMVDHLEKQRFIRKLPHPEDRRASILEATPEGEQVYHEAGKVFRAYREMMLEGVTPEEEKIILAGLEKITANLRSANAGRKGIVGTRGGTSSPS